MKNYELKKELFEKCKNILESKINHLQDLMDQEQATANEFVGAMSSRYDTFKEEAQDKKSALAKQLSSVQITLSNLLHIKSNNTDKIEYGKLVIMDGNIGFFMFTNFLETDLNLRGISIKAISTISPLGKELTNKVINDIISFRGKEYRVIDVI